VKKMYSTEGKNKVKENKRDVEGGREKMEEKRTEKGGGRQKV